MTEQEVYKKLSKEAPTGYKMNELIPFSYPVRKIKIDVLVNKQPDGSLVKVYNVLLRAIQAGFDSQSKLFHFLGLGETDEFILRELFTLREKGFVDLVSEKWIVTESGEQFIKDNTILRVEEEEEFEFLIDGISGDILSINDNHTSNKLDKYLKTEFLISNRSSELIESKYQELSNLYKREKENKAYLISYSSNDILFDSFKNEESGLWCNYWLIEYIPDKKSSQEAKLEVRNHDSLRLNKELSGKFNSEYRHYIYTLSNTERKEIEEFPEIIETKHAEIPTIHSDISTLTIWETKQKFIEALQTVKNKILIESPWIKRATLEYLPLFEKILKEKKQLIILYGISDDAEHDYQTLKKVEQLQDKYKENFTLIDLPSHFNRIGSRMTGTHRKLVIKDNDYYIAGSFNFLSFAKQERQQVANEESMLVSVGVEKKWEQVKKEYNLKM
ncbi:hypothetical protein AGMMS50276_29890 [Synergistales bacterium]|nr:hypothetical protein AGMMS50276_29890 [Synergistales bacterium]